MNDFSHLPPMSRREFWQTIGASVCIVLILLGVMFCADPSLFLRG